MNRYLIAITYFFILLPYITVGKLFTSDIQPFAGFFAILYLLLNLGRVRIDRTMVILSFLSILALIFLVVGVGDGQFISDGEFLYKALAVPYAMILYIFINQTINRNIINTIIKFAYFYLAVCLFQFLLPELYALVFNNFVRAVKIADISGMRGISALTTEPSFTAVVLFTFILVVKYCHTGMSRMRTAILIGLLMLAIVATKSISGLLLLFLFLSWEAMKKFSIVNILIVLTLTFVAVSFFKDVRAVSFIYGAISNPGQILMESSFFYRFYYFVFGFVSLSYNTFGYVLGSVDLGDINAATNVFFSDSVPLRLLDRVGPGMNIPSTMGMGLMVYGWFYLLVYIGIFFPVYFSKRVPLQVKLLIFYLTAQSFSFAFSLLWLLVVMAKKDLFRHPYRPKTSHKPMEVD